MALPKKRTPSSKRDQRRSHHAVTAVAGLRACDHCKKLTRSHQVCPHCGFYKGVEYFEPQAIKSQNKRDARRAHNHDHEHND